MKELQEARAAINEADARIAAAFCDRMKAVRAVADYKKAHGLPVLDAAREAAVIEAGAARVADPTLRGYYTEVLRELMDVSKQYQHRLLQGARVAYSGVQGAFAHIAATHIFPDAETRAFGGFAEAYAAVEWGECDVAVLPIENSYAGDVGQVMDLALHGSLWVSGVYHLHVTQHLLGVPGARLQDVRRVISHPQALAQCDGYLRRHGFATEQATNTALAAKAVAEQHDPAVAAIASAETAELYGLTVLERGINENAENSTRFAVFTREREESARGRNGAFILLFTVNNVAGGLANAINVIGKYGYNMRVLRSRSLRAHAWKYYFYVEAEGDERTPAGEAMLKELGAQCDLLKVLGHYVPDSVLAEEETR